MTDASSTTRVPLVRSIVALVAALASGVIIYAGFTITIVAALDGSGTDSGRVLGPIMFFGGAALWLAAVIVAIVALARREPKALPIATLAVSTLPLLGFIALVISARGSV
jgi:hypothetical protein